MLAASAFILGATGIASAQIVLNAPFDYPSNWSLVQRSSQAQRNPSLVVHKGRFYIAWSEPNGTLNFAVSNDAGASYGPPYSYNANVVQAPSLASDGNSLYVAWTTRPTVASGITPGQIKVATVNVNAINYAPNGLSNAYVINAGSTFSAPRLAAVPGQRFVSWTDGGVMRMALATNSFTKPIVLGNENSADAPSMRAIDGTRVVISWHGMGNNYLNYALVTLDKNGGLQSLSQRITQSAPWSTTRGTPDLADGGSGSIISTWSFTSPNDHPSGAVMPEGRVYTQRLSLINGSLTITSGVRALLVPGQPTVYSFGAPQPPSLLPQQGSPFAAYSAFAPFDGISCAAQSTLQCGWADRQGNLRVVSYPMR